MIMFVRVFYTKDILPIHFYRFVDIVMVLIDFYSRNSQIESAKVRYVSSFFLPLMKPFSLLQ
eukprot:TRINITY_DN3216_c1_g1_i2.p3 TRINITY_DN3216_c1_g1~~TRINITY_DN3216_c1_g1_i2.p3  ORF type:complete len:62 (+),score=10.69 TRINITY_DN3216_c1_g1_i2:238-423(+)